MTPREKVLHYLLQTSKTRPVEEQLRQQWLKELQQNQLNKVVNNRH